MATPTVLPEGAIQPPPPERTSGLLSPKAIEVPAAVGECKWIINCQHVLQRRRDGTVAQPLHIAIDGYLAERTQQEVNPFGCSGKLPVQQWFASAVAQEMRVLVFLNDDLCFDKATSTNARGIAAAHQGAGQQKRTLQPCTFIAIGHDPSGTSWGQSPHSAHPRPQPTTFRLPPLSTMAVAIGCISCPSSPTRMARRARANAQGKTATELHPLLAIFFGKGKHRH